MNAINIQKFKNIAQNIISGFINYPKKRKEIRDNSITLSMWSCNGYIDEVKKLVEKGADVKFDDCEALVSSARQGKIEVMEYLMSKGADIHVKKYDIEDYIFYKALKLMIVANETSSFKPDEMIKHESVAKLCVENGSDIKKIKGYQDFFNKQFVNWALNYNKSQQFSQKLEKDLNQSNTEIKISKRNKI